MKIVTGASPFIDIDAYGGIVAYTELLQNQGHNVQAVSTVTFNESITPSMLSLNAAVSRTYTPDANDTFILIDISNPERLDPIVKTDKVEAILDHHTGYEEFWQPRLGEDANIEFVGAACTQVYEAWEKARLLERMSPVSAKLLAAGILDNTLNFGAKITTARDKKAYDHLVKVANLNPYFAIEYFDECQEQILKDLPYAIKNDYKTPLFDSLSNELICFGQLTLWNADEVLSGHYETIKQTLSDINEKWFMNLINLKAGKSYFMAEDPAIKKWLEDLLGLHFDGSVAHADRLWLRKEVVKQAESKKVA